MDIDALYKLINISAQEHQTFTQYNQSNCIQLMCIIIKIISAHLYFHKKIFAQQ